MYNMLTLYLLTGWLRNLSRLRTRADLLLPALLKGNISLRWVTQRALGATLT